MLEAKEVAKDIFGHLEFVFPIVKEHNGSFVRFHENVILPSVKLATAIQTSSNRYSFSPKPLDVLAAKWSDVGMEELKHVT